MREYLLFLVLAFSSSYAIEKNQPAEDPYSPKDFSYLKGMVGFSDAMLDMHFTLYKGYVKNVNLLLKEMASAEIPLSPATSEMKRRFAFEYDGMRLHELYFENLGGKQEIQKDSSLFKLISRQYGSFAAWKSDFIATGLMRGIGWAVLCRDSLTGRLFNAWIGDHQVGLLANSSILLVMDVWEHAYITEYGLDREGYIKSFFNSIDWKVVEGRLRGSSISNN